MIKKVLVMYLCMLFIVHTYLFQGYNYLPPCFYPLELIYLTYLPPSFYPAHLDGHERFNILRVIWEPYRGTYKKKKEIKRVLLTFEFAQKARALHS
jgi:hypothetical protein